MPCRVFFTNALFCNIALDFEVLIRYQLCFRASSRTCSPMQVIWIENEELIRFSQSKTSLKLVCNVASEVGPLKITDRRRFSQAFRISSHLPDHPAKSSNHLPNLFTPEEQLFPFSSSLLRLNRPCGLPNTSPRQKAEFFKKSQLLTGLTSSRINYIHPSSPLGLLCK